MKTTTHNNTVIVLILGSLATVSPFSIDMYLPAFSEIASDFGTTPARVSLSVTSYFIGLALGQMIYGPLLDRYGRKTPLYVGLTLFVITCIGCMQAQTTEALVALRFLQALGGCVAWVAARCGHGAGRLVTSEGSPPARAGREGIDVHRAACTAHTGRGDRCAAYAECLSRGSPSGRQPSGRRRWSPQPAARGARGYGP